MSPGKRSSGFQFSSIVPDDIIPRHYVEQVEQGIRDSLGSGIQYGYPVEDVGVMLIGGSYHADISSDQDFQYVGSIAFREGCMKAHPVLLSPFMSVEISLPNEFLGDVIGNLQMRKASIEGIETKKQFQIIRALVTAFQNVRLCYRSAIPDTGKSDLFNAVIAFRCRGKRDRNQLMRKGGQITWQP